MQTQLLDGAEQNDHLRVQVSKYVPKYMKGTLHIKVAFCLLHTCRGTLKSCDGSLRFTTL